MGSQNAYAQVIRDAEKRGVADEFGKKLIAYMRAKGHLSLLKGVIKKLEREELEPHARVTVARESDAKKFEQIIHNSLNTLGVDPSRALITHDAKSVGGYSIRAGSLLIDKSFRSSLVSLYRRTTHK